MTIGDFMETNDAHRAQSGKDELFHYIVSLEQTLDEAEAYGTAGNIRMLTVLGKLGNVEEEMTYYAQRANEQKPMRNYHIEIGKLIVAYLPVILKKELADIETALAEDPDTTEDAEARLNQLEHIIGFYSDLYSELDLAPYSKKITEMNARFKEEA